MPDESLFAKEEEVVRNAEAFLAAPHDEAELVDAHARLLKDYKKLFNQTKRLMRMDDRNQAELSTKTKELHLRNQFIKTTFGRYMSDEVVEELLESPDGLDLGGKSLTVTVLFSDLRGFSAMSESLPPETVVEILNDYLKEMTRIIFKHSGTINEIMGDGILMLFGAPTPRPDDADRAIACALEMQLAMAGVNANLRHKGLPELEMGIGINTGKVVAGNIGSDMRVKYAVVGSNVNLAARVESFTVGRQILATESTRNAVANELKILGERSVPFKGIRQPVTLYDIGGIGGAYSLHLPDIHIDFRNLAEKLEVAIEILDGKQSSGKIESGRIGHLAEKAALLESAAELLLYCNVKISLSGKNAGEEALYAKVLKQHEDGRHEIRFTFVPDNIRAVFDSLQLQDAG